MVDHQEHFGKKFYQDKKAGYWISTCYPRIRAHQWIWISIHGLIPKGYHIHHKNENRSDNRIENLELIEKSRHMSHHMTRHMRDPKRIEKAKINCEKIRPLTKEWHRSPEGKAWHKLHAIKCNLGNWQPTTYQCQECGKEYQSKKKSRVRFCHNNCRSKWRRKAGLDNIEFGCLFCQKKSVKNKYAKTKYCSRKCAQSIRSVHI